jgi:CBS domain-containing protein
MAKTVQEIMTRNPTCARPESAAADAAQMMRREDVGAIPVVDGDRLIGIVTDRDLALDVLGERKPHETPVRDVMTTHPITATLDTTVHDAGELMQRNQIRRLPIVDRSDHLVGIVSLADLALDTNSDTVKINTLEGVSTPTHA